MLLQDSGVFGARYTARCSRLDELGQSEVEDLGMTIGRDHDVVGLEISMDDTGVVSLRESFRDVLQSTKKFRELLVVSMNLLALDRAVDILLGNEV